jgi:hypothetical protein
MPWVLRRMAVEEDTGKYLYLRSENSFNNWTYDLQDARTFTEKWHAINGRSASPVIPVEVKFALCE